MGRHELAVEWLAESLEAVLRQRLGAHLHLHVQSPDQVPLSRPPHPFHCPARLRRAHAFRP